MEFLAQPLLLPVISTGLPASMVSSQDSGGDVSKLVVERLASKEVSETKEDLRSLS